MYQHMSKINFVLFCLHLLFYFVALACCSPFILTCFVLPLVYFPHSKTIATADESELGATQSSEAVVQGC